MEEKTLNLPKTDFPMKANLVTLEPAIVAKNKQAHKFLTDSSENPDVIIHDGPPYANGAIHMGHVYNKLLKEILVRFHRDFLKKTTHFVAGWDCHGLPIELALKKKGEKDITVDGCRVYAAQQVESQSAQFESIGLLLDDKYLTMDASFEEAELNAFNTLVSKNLIHVGMKPVHWCCSCQTALATAEIEYKDKEDTAAYVLFESGRSELKYLVWTTTPWTLKANEYIAFNEEIEYTIINLPGHGRVVVSNHFADKHGFEKLDSRFLEINEEYSPTYKPLFDDNRGFNRPMFHAIVKGAPLVREDIGTGFVHIAPLCGTEDYLAVVQRYGSIGKNRKEYMNERGLIDGVHYTKLNTEILSQVEVWKTETITHSYPYCDRCHNPLVERATKQVFLDYSSQKDLILREAEKITFCPPSTKPRFFSFVNSRTEWVLSRNRTWGVPIPLVACKECKKDSFDTVCTVEEWRNEAYKSACDRCGSENTEKYKFILDVWFDSGLTYKALPRFKVDFICEGSDQHRGWFQSLHILSCLLENETCLHNVFSHGFILDDKKEKMSKSAGNGLTPKAVLQKYGSEVLRLWVMSQKLGTDITLSDTVLANEANSYRKLRNTLRFLLGNLFDYIPNTINVVDVKQKEDIDTLVELFRNSMPSGLNSDFYSGLKQYVDHLSATFLNDSKPVLYEGETDGTERRNIQSTMKYILDSLVRMMEVFLPITIQELKEHY
jgi:isoleucyl-tRNA synthetase